MSDNDRVDPNAHKNIDWRKRAHMLMARRLRDAGCFAAAKRHERAAEVER